MDLKLKDVAELLNVSETTIRRWIADSKIPYYRLNHQFRFSRSEIENWVLSCKQGTDFSPFDKEEENSKERLGTQQFGLYRAIHKGGVYIDVPGDTKEEVIRSAMKLIARDLQLDAEVITELLLDREKLMPTALSNGIGVPHTRDFLLQESYDVIAVVFPKNPIEYGALDNQPVHTLFFLFACDDKRHLHLLAKLAHLSSKPENLTFLQTHP
ncbi:MAG TPA: PTS sugar transporter subunit IIA, partial [Chlamydiales bacterium]|nr:PTS sugar transporter subunit IIA [Chlamydiales bacterium]